MKLSGGTGSEDRNKRIAIAAFVLIAAGVVYFEYFATGGASTPAPAAVSAPASLPESSATTTSAPRPVVGGVARRWGRRRRSSIRRCTWARCW